MANSRKQENQRDAEAEAMQPDQGPLVQRAGDRDAAGTEDPPRDSGQEQVDERMGEATEAGFIGTEIDPTPNENYTVTGVTSGAPTPETDPEAAAEARRVIERNRVR